MNDGQRRESKDISALFGFLRRRGLIVKADASVGKKGMIEADMRRPKLGALMGIGDTTGLATYLADPSVSLVDVSKRVPVANRTNGAGEPLTMDVVVSGSVPGNPSELINSESASPSTTHSGAPAAHSSTTAPNRVESTI